jgi:hypothetical protein
MRIKRLTLSIVMIAIISPNLSFGRGLGQSGGKLIRVEKAWGGVIKLKLQRQAPPNGFIANEEAWAKLWRVYRESDELPKIDFDKQMILVRLGNDLGMVLDDFMLNEKGDLKAVSIGNLGCNLHPKFCQYQFLLISREGVKSVNGKPIRED